MGHDPASYQISENSGLYVAAALFVSFLGAALVIHARNQAYDPDSPTPKTVAWAKCSRGLFWAALWAALGVVVPMIAQAVALIHQVSPDADLGTTFLISKVATTCESAALIFSITAALYTVTKI